MKTKTLFFTFLFVIQGLNAICQPFNPEIIISNGVINGYNVYADDIDGDGDLDIVSIGLSTGNLAWHENLDGLGSFGSEQIITPSLSFGIHTTTCDIDGDGDPDVLSASYNDDKIAWYENTDGLGSFGSQQLLDPLDGAYSIYGVDIDGDGDNDIVACGAGFDGIGWYENTDGLGTFGSVQIFNPTSCRSIFPSDIDGDGDIDIAAVGGNDVFWMANTDGLGTFGSAQIISSSISDGFFTYVTDIDGDLDMDILSASEDDDKIAWYENTDGLGTFGGQQVITTLADWANGVYAADIDLDGDMDVLSTSNADDKTAWYENTDGLGSFGPQQVITTLTDGVAGVIPADLDRDGDVDIITASTNDNDIAWHENLLKCAVGFSSTITEPLCNGGADGEINISITAGSPPYVFAWSSGQTTEDISALSAGVYDLTITDASACEGQQSFTVTEPTAISPLIADLPTSCIGNSDGIGYTIGSGGTPGYSYLWDDPSSQTNPSATGLYAGVYNCTTTDGNGCVTVTPVSITDPPSIVSSVSVVDPSCFGESDGGAVVVTTGSLSDYTFQWNTAPIQTDDIATGLSVGLYKATVTEYSQSGVFWTEDFDGSACASNCTAASVGWTELTNIGANGPEHNVWYASCAENGNLNGECGGGCGSGSGGSNDNSLHVSTHPTNLGDLGASYDGSFDPNIITNNLVQSPQINCSGKFNINIDFVYIENGEGADDGCELYFFDGGTWTLLDALAKTPVGACGIQGQWTAFSTTLPPSANNNPYVKIGFFWHNDDDNVGNDPSFAVDDITLTSNSIPFCEMVENITVEEPPVLTITSSTLTEPTCNGSSDGMIEIEVAGGTPFAIWEEDFDSYADGTTVGADNNLPFGNDWSRTIGGGTDYFETVNNEMAAEDTDSEVVWSTELIDISGIDNVFATLDLGEIGGLEAGDYIRVYYKIDGGPEVLFADYSNDFATATATISSLSGTTLEIVVRIFNNAAGEIHYFDNVVVGFYDFYWSTGASTQNVTGLAAGVYTVTVEDDHFCSYERDITLTEPSALLASAGIDANFCESDASAPVDGSPTATGGTTPYVYAWSGTGLTNTSSAVATFDPAVAGAGSHNLDITVTDNNGCVDSDQATYTVNPIPTISTTLTDPLCNGGCDGTVSASSSTGTGPFNFSWDGGLGSGSTITAVCSGTYAVTATDANSCVASSSGHTVNDPALLGASPSMTPVTCNGGADGSINSNATGGTGSPTYQWYSDPGLTIPIGGATSATYVGAAGDYYVQVTDANGCFTSAGSTITEPTVVNPLAGSDQTLCDGNNANLNGSASGGVGGFTYVWSGGAGTFTPNNTDPNATYIPPGVGSETLTLQATDGNGCAANDNVDIINNALPTISTTLTDPLCNGSCDGVVSASSSTGSAPFNFSWDGGLGSGSTINSVCAGTYGVTATDANSCISSSSGHTLNNPTALSITVASITTVTCNGGFDGAATVTSSGGTGGHNYTWYSDAGLTVVIGGGNAIGGMNGGTIYAEAVDANGCSISTPVTISEPAAVLASAGADYTVCYGDPSNMAASASGGIGSITYLWTTSGIGSMSNATDPNMVYTHSVAEGGSAINFSITATDDNGCSDNDDIVVTINTDVIASITSTDPSCNGGFDGYADAFVAGGTPTYSYLWSNSSSTTGLSGLASGTYGVTITDSYGCEGSSSVLISDPAGMTLTSAVTSNYNGSEVSCNGSNDGTANVTVTGGATPYSFSWTNGDSNQNTGGLSDGLYTVTVFDNSLCEAYSSVTVTEPTVISFDGITATDAICNGSSDGALQVVVSGGSGLDYIDWYNDAYITWVSSANPYTTASAGVYYVEATDLNGCTYQGGSVTVSEPPAITVSAGLDQNVCESNPSVTVTGSTNSASVLWSTLGDGTFSSPSGLSSSYIPGSSDITGGSATLTFSSTGNTPCPEGNDNLVVIIDPSPIVISSITAPPSCFGDSDGAISISVTSGVTPYTFNWSTGQTSQNINLLGDGTYDVTITDANSCIETESIGLSQPTALSLTQVCNNTSGSGASDGSSTTTASGGTTPYSYSWSSGDVTQDITGIPSGSYSVTVTDNNGCEINDNCSVSDAASSCVITNFNANIGLCNQTTDEYCLSGDVFFTSPPASGTLIVEVDNGTSTYDTIINLPFNSPQTWSICGIPSDGASSTVDVYFSDDPGCNSTINFTAPTTCACNVDAGTFTYNMYGDGLNNYQLCYGDSISFYGNGDFIPPTEMLNPPLAGGNYDPGLSWIVYSCPPTLAVTPTLANTIPDDPCFLGVMTFDSILTYVNDTNSLLHSYPQGTFTDNIAYIAPLTMYDLGGGTYSYVNGTMPCYEMGPATAVQFLPEIIDTAISNCAANNVSVTLYGGLPEIDNSYYQLSNLMPNTATLSADSSQHGETLTITGLNQGDQYSFDVFDANGCPKTIMGVFGLDSVYLTTADATCGASDGSVTANVAGGTSPFVYDWYDPALTPIGTGQSLTGIPVGTYIAVATDANGCSDYGGNFIQNIGAPTITGLSGTPTTCAESSDGSTSVTAIGGSTPYTYMWQLVGTVNLYSGQTATGLPQGDYIVTVNDASNCSSILPWSVNGPDTLAGTLVCTNTSTAGGSDGSSSITVTGGTTPYSYDWGNGTTSSTLTGLSAGAVAITATDANGCFIFELCSVSDPGGCGISVTSTILNPDSCGAGYGSVSSIASGGTSPYTYQWDNGSTTNLASGLYGGVNFLTVTDGGGCVEPLSVTIPGGAIDSLIVTTTMANCGASDGSATAVVYGGTSPYFFIWFDSNLDSIGTGPSLTNIPGGTYIVATLDAAGCDEAGGNFVYNIGAPIPVASTSAPTSCGDSSDGVVSVSVTGGTPPYSYTWQNLDEGTVYSGQTATGVPQGTYLVTITDSQLPACEAYHAEGVGGPELIEAFYSNSAPETCAGSSDAFVTPLIIGGVSPYTYNWSDGSTGTSLTNVASGDYSLTITDNIGCVFVDSGFVDLLSDITLTASSIPESCAGGDGAVSVLANGGVTAYTYVWGGLGSGPTHTGVSPGTYVVTVTDGVGCSDTASVVVGGGTPISFVTFQYSDTCSSGAGIIKVDSVSGGGGTYYYSLDDVNYQSDNSFTGLVASTFSVYVTDSAGCTTSTFASVGDTVVDLSPLVSITNDTICPEDDEAEIGASGGNQTYWLSTGDYGTTLSVSVDSTTYFPFDITKGTCVYRDSAVVYVETGRDCWDLTVETPNAFSPDGDGDNDLWIIPGIEFTSNKVTIFNRWGDYIAEIENYDNSSMVWNGTNSNGEELPTGTYFYVIEIDGEIFEKDWIQIVR